MQQLKVVTLKCWTVCQMCQAVSAFRVEGGNSLTFVLFQRSPAQMTVRLQAFLTDFMVLLGKC